MRTDLQRICVRTGTIVMVHASVRKIGPILGGVNTLVHALLDAIGPEGTLVAYVDWELGYDPYATLDEATAAEIPVFDKRIARAARSNGILSEVIRTWPGAIRSDNPDAGVAAIGAQAAYICADHPLQYGYGDDSPYAKLVELDAKVLLIGAPLDTITLLHHAEHVADVPHKRIVTYRRKILVDGEPRWVEIEEYDTSEPIVLGMPDDHFARIAEAALDKHLAWRDRVGAARSYLFKARSLRETGVAWLEDWTRGATR